jgi:hypothetical protein
MMAIVEVETWVATIAPAMAPKVVAISRNIPMRMLL